ncbi:MAG: 30S ribosomal protein S6 [Alphaproteobacteria bacterium]|nr:30S ribosomal protein S6 [Alphaproteobacteria bacterium]
MANYESVLIARQDLGASQVNTLVDSLSEVLKKEGGEVVKIDNWGLKNLAYRIKKNRKGHYVLLNIVAPAKAIFEYERLMRLNEDVIRYMTIKVDEFNNEMTSDEEIAAVEEQA